MSEEQSKLELYAAIHRAETIESRETIEGVQEYLEAIKKEYGKVVTEREVRFYLRKTSA